MTSDRFAALDSLVCEEAACRLDFFMTDAGMYNAMPAGGHKRPPLRWVYLFDLHGFIHAFVVDVFCLFINIAMWCILGVLNDAKRPVNKTKWARLFVAANGIAHTRRRFFRFCCCFGLMVYRHALWQLICSRANQHYVDLVFRVKKVGFMRFFPGKHSLRYVDLFSFIEMNKRYTANCHITNLQKGMCL